MSQGTDRRARAWRFLSGRDRGLARDAESLPRRLGRFELLELLGEGGSAVVFRALDEKLGREVAVKMIKDPLGAASVPAARFLREVRATASLSHPNIVGLYDAGEEEGRRFLVMEHVDGRSLDRVLAGGHRPMRWRLEVLEKVARAIHVAHARGIIHRDLKPANILVSSSGEPKVTDFGLACWSGRETMVTATGAALGTPAYMAPEQAEGRRELIGPRTDVYALGAILYEMLAGLPPHTGSSVAEVLGEILRRDPLPLRGRDPSLSRDLEAVCMKALERSPAARHATAGDLADDVRRFLDGRPVAARRMTPWRRAWLAARRHPVRAVTVAAAVLIALVVVGNVVAGLRADAMRREAELARRRARARALIEASRAELPAHAALLRRIAEGRAELLELVETVPRWSAGEDKQELWDVGAELAAARHEEQSCLSAISSRLIQAFGIGVDPERDEARELLAGLYWDELAAAERRHDADQAALWESLVRQHDHEDARWARRLDEPAAVALRSEPPGARVLCLRYADQGDGRRLPVSSRGALADDASGLPETTPADELGRTPLTPAPIPPGSHLLVLRRPGFRDVRLPVMVGRGETPAYAVRLYTDDEIGPDFVQVPAGEFVYGGDIHADSPEERHRRASTGEFFIARFEVTIAEYLVFVNDLLRSIGIEAALARAPGYVRTSWGVRPDGGEIRIPPGWDGRWPVSDVSWTDATAYAAWLTRRRRRAGDEALYRLPTNVEWLKAARGVDGRSYPWGDGFDWTFTLGGWSRPGGQDLEPVGSYPADVSPYGVRDMAGSMQELCADWIDEVRRWRHVRGGDWHAAYAAQFRLANRFATSPERRAPHRGFRLVRELPDAQR